MKSSDVDEANGPKWRILARRAGARTLERAEPIAQQMSDRFDRLRGGSLGPMQQLLDELQTFEEWIVYCQSEECTFEDYLRWRPPLRPRRRRKQH